MDFKRSAFEVAITALEHAIASAQDAASAARYLIALVESLVSTGQYEAAADAAFEALRADQRNLKAATLLGAWDRA